MKTILDWKEYENTARSTNAEGCVLLENNGVLPLKTMGYLVWSLSRTGLETVEICFTTLL